MQVEQTFIDGLKILSPKIFSDERGYYFESYNKIVLKELGINAEFVQDGESFSKYGTLRGLHFQVGEAAQAKLVRVIKGSILDVAVDLRPSSSTFGQHFAIELTEDNKKQLFIPRGFAHGFIVLSEYVIMNYKCDNFYNKQAEAGVRYNDKDLAIDWRIPQKSMIINERDQNFPFFKELRDQFK